MSATLDAAAMGEYFDAPVLYVSGRTHPVQVKYTCEPVQDYVDAALTTILQVHRQEPPVRLAHAARSPLALACIWHSSIPLLHCTHTRHTHTHQTRPPLLRGYADGAMCIGVPRNDALHLDY